MDRRIQLAAIAVAVATLLAGPAAYAVQTDADRLRRRRPGGRSAGRRSRRTGRRVRRAARVERRPRARAVPGGNGPSFAAGGAGGPGGGQVDSAIADYLAANRGTARWIVAVSSANQAGSIELATGQPVMAMGGFSGSDPTPTLEQLQAYVASGALRFVIVGGGGGPGGGSTAVSTWVTSACTAVSAVSTTLYDCSGAVAAG